MKQRTIIQVWGAYDKGKTSTIKIVREELVIKYINPPHRYLLPMSKDDISDVLSCIGYRVGIESMGDVLNSALKSRLDDLIHASNCDVIICASRVYNDVSRYIELLAPTNGYRLLKVTNYRGQRNDFNQDNLNQESARHLVDLVGKILTGVI